MGRGPVLWRRLLLRLDAFRYDLLNPCSRFFTNMASKVACHSAVSTKHTEVSKNVYNSPPYTFPLEPRWRGLQRVKNQTSVPGRETIFLYAASTRLAMGTTQLPIQWLSRGFLPKDNINLSVKLITQSNVVPKSRMQGATPPRLCISSRYSTWYS
jgi:hypothetical protein